MRTVGSYKVNTRNPIIPSVPHGRQKCPRCNKSRDCYSNDLMVRAVNLSVPVCAECLNYQYMVFRLVAVKEVIQKHEASRHAFDGARVTSSGGIVQVHYPKPRLTAPDERVGVSCFVWIDGCLLGSSNCLDLNHGVEEELRAIPGIRSVRVALD